MAIDLHDSDFADLLCFAQRELGAFMSAVAELYGPEQATISGRDWLHELESMDGARGLTTRQLWMITIRAAAQLASRLIGTSGGVARSIAVSEQEERYENSDECGRWQ
jgi:hypothetical protein